MEKLTIYHGSECIVEKPEYGKGKLTNDYGRGFYCTQSIVLAKEWSVGNNRDGYANIYHLDLSELNILDLSDKKYNTLHWITILLQNRVFDLKNDIVKAAKQYLVSNFASDLGEYNLIKGYRARRIYEKF